MLLDAGWLSPGIVDTSITGIQPQKTAILRERSKRNCSMTSLDLYWSIQIVHQSFWLSPRSALIRKKQQTTILRSM